MKRTKLTLASGCSVKVSGNIHRDASVSVGPFIWVWYRVVNRAAELPVAMVRGRFRFRVAAAMGRGM